METSKRECTVCHEDGNLAVSASKWLTCSTGIDVSALLSPNTISKQHGSSLQELGITLVSTPTPQQPLTRVRVDVESDVVSCSRISIEASHPLRGSNSLASATLGADCAPLTHLLQSGLGVMSLCERVKRLLGDMGHNQNQEANWNQGGEENSWRQQQQQQQQGLSAGLALEHKLGRRSKMQVRCFTAPHSYGTQLHLSAARQVSTQHVLQLTSTLHRQKAAAPPAGLDPGTSCEVGSMWVEASVIAAWRPELLVSLGDAAGTSSSSSTSTATAAFGCC